METYKLSTGLYGKKAEQLVTLIWKLTGIGDIPFQRLDYFTEPRHMLLQKDYFTLSMKEGNAPPNKLLTTAMARECSFSHVKAWNNKSERFFDPQFCINIELDESGEVCCIINMSKATTMHTTSSSHRGDSMKLFLLKELYDALRDSVLPLSKFLKKVISRMSGDEEYDGIAYLTREVSMSYKDCFDDIEFDGLKLFEKTVSFTMKDLTVFTDMIWRIAQTLHLDNSMWKPHPSITFTEDEYYEMLGREETDPFIISKNVIVQDKLKSIILDFISRSEDEVEKLKEKFMVLKSNAEVKVITESSKEASELSLLLS